MTTGAYPNYFALAIKIKSEISFIDDLGLLIKKYCHTKYDAKIVKQLVKMISI